MIPDDLTERAARPSVSVLTVLCMFLLPVLGGGRASCQSPAVPILDTLIDQLLPPQVINLTPIIVSGRIAAIQQKSTTSAAGLPGVDSVSLMEARVQLLQVFRGQVPPGPTLSMEWYAADVQPDYRGRRLLRIQPGRTYLLLLHKSGSKLRLVADVYEYAFELFGSSNCGSGLQGNERLAQCLLSTESGPRAEEFALQLHVYAQLASHLATRAFVRRALQQLICSEGSPVRIEACLEMARKYYGSSDCLRVLVYNKELPDVRRAAIQRTIEGEQQITTWLKMILEDPASFAFAHHAPTQSWRSLQIETELLLEHPDADIRRLACAAMRRYFPEAPAERCHSAVESVK